MLGSRCHAVVGQNPLPRLQKRADGQLHRAELEGKGLKVVLAKEPTVVAGYAFTSGRIPRLTDCAQPPPAARLEAGTPGSGGEPSHHFLPGALQVDVGFGELVPDIFQIQKAPWIDKVHAVVGGCHLAPSPKEIVDKTLAAFKEIDPDDLTSLVVPPLLDKSGGERGSQERFQACLVCAGEIDCEIGG